MLNDIFDIIKRLIISEGLMKFSTATKLRRAKPISKIRDMVLGDFV